MAELDKFYTNRNIAKKCVETLRATFSIGSEAVYLEPTAGDGAFLDFLDNYEAYDLKPEDPRVVQQDIFALKPTRADYITVGNPPFRQTKQTRDFGVQHCGGIFQRGGFHRPSLFLEIQRPEKTGCEVQTGS